MTEIIKIKMDYLENPIGVIKTPQFSWVLGGSGNNIIQSAYRLQIRQEDALLYDSETVESDESAHVFVKGLTLESGKKYGVRVKVWTKCGEETKWSYEAFFVTGLLSHTEWQGVVISGESKEEADKSNGTCLRNTFTLTGEIKEAYAFTTALGLYKLYINGAKVGKDEMAPGWTSYHKRLLYQTYDITEYLQTGENTVGVMLGAGWYKGKMGFIEERNNYGMQTGLLGQLCIRFTDGRTQIISTDENWRCANSPIIFSEIYDGEIYDARLEQEGWNETGFDDAAWQRVQVIPFDKSILTPQAGTKVEMIDELPVKRIFTTPQGDRVLDFGQNLTGWIEIRIKGKRDEKVEWNCFEVLDLDGNVYLDNLRGAKQTITYICKNDEEVVYHPSFTFQGFQYARIVHAPGEIKPENFTAYTVHSNMKPTGTFTCSNPDLNQLQHNILWSCKGNFLDVPTDCPQRNERVGWTGDAQIFCRTASYLMDTYTFFAKWLKDVTADQTPEGGVPHIVPDIVSGREGSDWLLSQGTHSAAAWADAAVINPWILYLTYGDTAIIEEQYDSMKAWIDFMKTHAVDGIWNYKLQFGDWVALDAEEGSYFGATPNDLTCTAYYAYSTGLFAKMAKVIGKQEDAKEYERLHKEIVKGFQNHFFDKAGNLTAATQTAHIIALYFDLVPKTYRSQIAAALVELLKKENGHLVTGFVGTPYFCHALSQNGYVKEAYELLLKEDFPSWLYQVKHGATTIWEHWDGCKPDGTMWSPDMNSFNHYAYGAIGEWLYRVVAGIEIDEEAPGYHHFYIHPHMGGGLTYVNASYESVYGKISAAWETTQEETQLTVDIPHNTTATIYLDHCVKVIDSNNLSFTQAAPHHQAIAGSGHHRIVFRRDSALQGVFETAPHLLPHY